ncbi:MAG: putative zinc metalloprotease, partial [Candidatus Anoxychlamydiales bacterium]|nr:putative zinc metalloprotease [Candidatus Anoxychlamydiales bacterium]
MIENIFYIILAILGLSFLVFIHEFGHYLMAKRVKMKIETFSIGFGKPIFSWYRKDIKWQIGMLPFGGFVKIAGMQKEGNKEPYEIKDGFFEKKPFQRIKVAVSGPIVNLVFAFLVFAFIWALGGRDKTFSEFTKKIGFIDAKSELYDLKVRPGDEIAEYNDKKYAGFNDILYSSLTNGKSIEIKGNKINYFQDRRVPFEYTLRTYPDYSKGKDFSTIGVLAPASYLFFDKSLDTQNLTTVMQDKQIKNNDRILWANGEIVFSLSQLNAIINDASAFLTIQRKDEIFHTKINLVKIADLKTSHNFKNDLNDWRYLDKMKTNLNKLSTIPYSFNDNAIIVKSLNFIDETVALRFLNNRNAYSVPLKKGDKILAIGGNKITNGASLLTHLQNPEVLLITQRDPALLTKKTPFKDIDKNFDKSLDIKSLSQIVKYLGTSKEVNSYNQLHLLKPIEPITNKKLAKTNPMYSQAFLNAKKEISKIKNPAEQEEALKALKVEGSRKILGISLRGDKLIKYNPNPLVLFSNAFKEVFRTLVALITGLLSPKYLAGPIGIVQVVKMSWAHGYLEALYWLGFISLNLGILNLLPIPVLDGGHVVFS